MAHSVNLYKIKDTYYFRVRIPKDLKCWFSNHDIKRSLRTKVLTSAKRLVILWAAKTEKLFMTIRAGILAGIMTGKEIKKLIEEYIRHTLKKDDEGRIVFGVQHAIHETAEGPLYITESFPHSSYSHKPYRKENGTHGFNIAVIASCGRCVGSFYVTSYPIALRFREKLLFPSVFKRLREVSFFKSRLAV